MMRRIETQLCLGAALVAAAYAWTAPSRTLSDAQMREVVGAAVCECKYYSLSCQQNYFCMIAQNQPACTAAAATGGCCTSGNSATICEETPLQNDSIVKTSGPLVDCGHSKLNPFCQWNTTGGGHCVCTGTSISNSECYWSDIVLYTDPCDRS